MSITAMKQALEALQQTVDNDTALWEQCEAITALRAAISEQEQCEPVGYARYEKDKLVLMVRNTVSMDMFPLYTHPAPVPADVDINPETVLRLIETIKYMVGIAEKGRGYKCPDDVLPERFLLEYVIELEAPVPAGWQLVPVEPTDEMYMSLLDVKEVEDAREDMRNLWAAMLQAAPKHSTNGRTGNETDTVVSGHHQAGA